jgi:hypothetical protein
MLACNLKDSKLVMARALSQYIIPALNQPARHIAWPAGDDHHTSLAAVP